MNEETERRPGRLLLWVAFVLLLLAVLIFSMAIAALLPSKMAYAHPSEQSAPVATTVADLAPLPLAVAVSTAARPGEGVIRITTRVCGNANNWQSVAATNGIRPPVYLVLLGQVLSVPCVGGSAPSAQVQPSPQTGTGAVSGGWTAPVRACIVSGYGMRWGRMHWGVDLSAGYGVPIRAAAAGTVSTSWQSGAGNYTTINHGGGLYTVYMHQSSYAVRSGWVGAGQTIGYVGATGNASGPHLHFEVHTGGLWNGKVNPVPFMANRGVRLGC